MLPTGKSMEEVIYKRCLQQVLRIKLNFLGPPAGSGG
jgi:hypothetical protein